VTDHATSEMLAQFVDDTLAPEERTELETHLDTCDDCRSTVAMLAKAAAAERRSEPVMRKSGAAFDATMPAAPTRSSKPFAPGTKLGRYVLGETLGMGGMGVVYAAHDPDLHRDLAIKVLRPGLDAAVPDATKRIVREAQAMARVAHPNVVAVYDVGTVGDQVFIAMERITGMSLRGWLKASPRSPADILEMFIAAGQGLIAAHDAGMVHRDFKPDNVLIGADGRPRVTDFGLAFEQDDEPVSEVTSESTSKPIVGTPSYMAPEQHAGANVDARSDQFSFAVALYEALYGKRPFAGKTRDQLVDAIMNQRIESAPSRGPASLRAILVRSLSVKPGDRYPEMEDLLKALGRDRGRVPRIVALAAIVGLVIVGVAAGADAILRDRTHAVTRTSFASARVQLDKLLALRTDAFVAQADAVFRLPIMQEVATSRDQADFGLGDPEEDRKHLAEQHENLFAADWFAFIKTHEGDVLAIADQKGRLLFGSANPQLWGERATAISAIASAYASKDETYLGVIDAADPVVVKSGLLGGQAKQKLYVAFARAKRIGAKPNAMFLQLVEAGRLLDEVGVGDNTLLSVVTVEGVAEGHVPQPVLLAVNDGGIDEVALDDGTWLAQRTPLRAPSQDSAIAKLVLARRTNVGLSGLFPHARQTFGTLAVLLAAIALGGFITARRLDLTRRRS